MSCLISDSLYGQKHAKHDSHGAPRRRLRVHNAPQPPGVDPVRSMPHGASSLAQSRTHATATPPAGDPISSLPLVQSPDAVPFSSNAITARDRMRISNDRGMEYDSSERIHNKTPRYMNRINRVVERSTVNPYTGDTEEFYRQLPPEGNKDYRIPAENMSSVNLRLMHAQGYDSSKPKPARKERLAEMPQPDGTIANGTKDSALYSQRMGEINERAMRDITTNKNGERPTWMRDHQRPFGFKGHHDMTRHTPNVPATLRADTLKPAPSAGQTSNPNPHNEVQVRGRHRDNSRKPHVEELNYKGQREAVVSAAPSYGLQTSSATKRASLENSFVPPGPAGGPLHSGRSGQVSDTSKNPTLIRNTAQFATNALIGAGSSAEGSTALDAFDKVHGSTGAKGQGLRGAVGSGLSVESGPVQSSTLPPTMMNETTNKRYDQQGSSLKAPSHTPSTLAAPQFPKSNDQVAQKRGNLPTNPAAKYSLEQSAVPAATAISSASDLSVNYRADIFGPAPSGFAAKQSEAQSKPYFEGIQGQRNLKPEIKGAATDGRTLIAAEVLANPSISRMITQESTRRSQNKIVNRDYAVMSAATKTNATAPKLYVGQPHKMEGKKSRPGPKGSETPGMPIRGEPQLKNGRRAETGARASTVTYSKGGVGENTAYRPNAQSTGGYNDRGVTDKTTKRNLRNESRPKLPMSS